MPAGELLIWYCRLVRSDGCATEDVMKAYVATTGSVFGLLVVAHIVRVIAEGPRVATDPLFTFMTVVAAVLCVWAGYLLRTRQICGFVV
ncbi:MAG: hypothetical protein DMG03_24185 [Acidobacteria bacterium]|nr:MAG: hypothetical protein DMG03_24185 [Acidobacteriota bacterium]